MNFVALFRGHGLAPGIIREHIQAESMGDAMRQARAMQGTTERHWQLLSVEKVKP